MSRGRLYLWLRKYLPACIVLLLCYSFIIAALGTTGARETNTAPSSGKGITVVIDAGHGGEDCGAVGVNGVLEKDINLTVASMLAGLFREAGVAVIETRTEDRLLYDQDTVPKGKKKAQDLQNRTNIANGTENALFVSIHMNSYPSPVPHGLQVWYGPGEGSAQLASAVQTAVRDGIQNDNTRKPKKSDGMIYILDHAECPAVLVECGFLSNPEECGLLSREDYQKELSNALFCAMMKYIGG